jgi:hypothetical protein
MSKVIKRRKLTSIHSNYQAKILEFSHGFEKILQEDYHIIWYTLEFRVPSNKFPGYLIITAKLSIKILLVKNGVIFSLTIYNLKSRGLAT